MRKIAIAVILILVLGGTTAAQAAQWTPFEGETFGGGQRVELIDSNAASSAQSSIAIVRTAQDGGGMATSVCGSWGIAPCMAGTSSINYFATIVLPICESKTQAYCVSAVSIYKSKTQALAATYVGETLSSKVVADSRAGLPNGGTPLVFKAEGIPHTGGSDLYYVAAVAELNFNQKTKTFEYLKFAISVVPFTTEKISNPVPALTPKEAGSKVPGPVVGNTTYSANEFSPNRPVALISETEKLVPHDFALDTRVGIEVNLPSAANGWFSGRIGDPVIDLTPVASGVNRLTLDGQALQVYRVAAEIPKGVITPQMKVLGLRGGGGANIESGSDFTLGWLDDLKPYTKDTNSGTSTVWNVRTTETQSSCFPKNKFNGIVTTNATAYSWNPPQLKNGSLNYQVGSFHFNRDGSIAKGSYDLVLDAEIARCLYKFSKAPFEATVSVTDSGTGEVEYATSIVSQSKGWLKVSANNFHFSNPVLKVKLTQKKITITCVSRTNSKLKKTITSASPKCPTGYLKR